jgi:membrane protease YdiL (CAAX protease family)
VTSSTRRFQVGSLASIAHGTALTIALLLVRAALLGTFTLLGTSPDALLDAPPVAFVALAVAFVLEIGFVLHRGLLAFGRLRMRELGWTFEHPERDIASGLAAWVATTLFLCALLWLFRGTHPRDLWRAAISWGLAQRLLFLGVGFSAALVEESIFRGYLQPSLIERWGAHKGIIATALFFSLWHLNLRPIAFLSKLSIGLALGVLRGRDRSLLAPATAHFATWALLGAV